MNLTLSRELRNVTSRSEDQVRDTAVRMGFGDAYDRQMRRRHLEDVSKFMDHWYDGFCSCVYHPQGGCWLEEQWVGVELHGACGAD